MMVEILRGCNESVGIGNRHILMMTSYCLSMLALALGVELLAVEHGYQRFLNSLNGM